MVNGHRREALRLLGVRSSGNHDGAEDLILETTEGTSRARYHPGVTDATAVLWIFGAGGGLGGPAGGVYERTAQLLAPQTASLQLDYRRPGNLDSCVLDVLLGIEYLKSRRHGRVILVGHSFGGAVAINAAIASVDVVAVAALSSQTYGVGNVTRISPRPILFGHGEEDEVLPYTCSVTLFKNAREPKTLKLYPGCRHGLDDCREQLDRDLQSWLAHVLVNEA